MALSLSLPIMHRTSLVYGTGIARNTAYCVKSRLNVKDVHRQLQIKTAGETQATVLFKNMETALG